MTAFKKGIHFCIAFLLIFIVLLSAGRSAVAEETKTDGTEETEETVPGVMLSGIKRYGSDMTEEECGMMEAVRTILDTADCDSVNNSYYITATAENITEYNLHCWLRLLYFDRDGTLLGDSTLAVSHWNSGSSIQRSAYVGDWLRSTKQVQASILYQHGTSLYQTEYRTITDKSGLAGDLGQTFTVKLAEDLPMKFTTVDSAGVESVFEIRSFEQIYLGDSQFVEMTIYKISGPDYKEQMLRFRTVRDDGVVVSNNQSVDIAGLQHGETFLWRASCYLDPGNYTLEFVDRHDADSF